MPKIALETRLKELNLSATRIKPADLEVPANKTVVLSASDASLKKNLAYLEPKTINDLKRWIGIPDQAFAHVPAAATSHRVVLHSSERVDAISAAAINAAILIQPSEVFQPNQIVALQGFARDYLFGHSASISPQQIPALDAWVLQQKIKIPILLFRDIHVAAGAVLDVKTKVLFANNITIDRGGLIKMGNQSSINAAGVRGL